MSNSLIIPVYRNQESIPELLDELQRLDELLDGTLEVVLVVDGSPDDCYRLLQEKLPLMRFASQLVLHSRNYGSFAAIRTGLELAKGDHFAVMAADLQEPIDLPLAFFERLRSQEVDVVVGSRDARADPWPTRVASACFWGIYRRLIHPQVPKGGVDVFGCNRAFRDALLALSESNTSLVGLIYWLGFRRQEVAYTRLERRHGKTAWTLRKKLRYMMDSFFAFSDLPIRMLLGIGSIGILVAIALGVSVVMARMTGAIQLSGYAATMVTILFFGALNTLALGIVGAYVWRAFANTQGRPGAVIMARTHHDRRPGNQEMQP